MEGGPLKLGVNIDHVATLRQARYATLPDSPMAEPDLVAAALLAEKGGADSITIHLRADRRHIQDEDLSRVRSGIATKLNLEIGNTPEIVGIALDARPDFVCLVPENREEVTTEGGLDVVANFDELKRTVDQLHERGVLVSMFVDPDEEQVAASRRIEAEMIELHTGAYANARNEDTRGEELDRLIESARNGHQLGLQVNAGHGITTSNLPPLFRVPHLVELNIGHHLVSRSIEIGLEAAVREMIDVMAGYPAAS